MDLPVRKPALPAAHGAVFRTNFGSSAFDRGLDDGTDVVLERQDEIRQLAVKARAVTTAQTSDSQAFAVTAAVSEMPLTLIPVPQVTATDRAGDCFPAPDKKRRGTVG